MKKFEFEVKNLYLYNLIEFFTITFKNMKSFIHKGYIIVQQTFKKWDKHEFIRISALTLLFLD